MERKRYKKLTYKDRQIIEAELNRGTSDKEIARIVDSTATTIGREKKRGGMPYSADRAQKALFTSAQ